MSVEAQLPHEAPDVDGVGPGHGDQHQRHQGVPQQEEKGEDQLEQEEAVADGQRDLD